MKIIETAQAQVMANAPTFAEVGGNILSFMLRIFGSLVIIALVIVSIMYFTAGGNEDQIKLAKKYFLYCIVGIFVALGAMIILYQVRDLLE
ncbi:MAG TPA: hypothetical protein DDY52_02900 [Candidatus Moranbacteria bacterium]|nr:MAG: hypothetical protein UR51_C0023G0016 [Candidatus Moranbacteria bacterium GW2011_GWF1_34_10]HBI17072.1 hypothetical protein [Candidatus Moranbacteria bacterium]